MKETAIVSDTPTPTPATSPAPTPALSAVADGDCGVSLVRGENLNSRQISFEISLLSLNHPSAAKPTLALRTPSRKFSLAIQSANQREKTAIPRSLALSAGLIGHGYVPEDWLCGLLTSASDNSELKYLTLFDSHGIYGRTELGSVELRDFPANDVQSALLRKQLRATRLNSIEPERILEALYIDHENINLDEPARSEVFGKLSDSLEILVEALPAPGSDLCAAGLRWLAAEVK
jgi:hypothetical protein